MRIGVVGAGKVGTLRVQTVKDNPDTELAAVFDVAADAARAAATGTQAKALTELEAFLDTPMDAVIVSTPPHLHEAAAVGALRRGHHVFCEKPLSNSVEGGRRIVDAAIAEKRALAVGFNLRYYPFVKFAREAVDSGKIGKIDHVRVYGGHNGLHNFSGDWQYKMPESGGGAMMDIGIHMSDLARYFLGEVTQVSGVMSEKVYGLPGSEDNAVAVFTSPEGIPGDLSRNLDGVERLQNLCRNIWRQGDGARVIRPHAKHVDCEKRCRRPNAQRASFLSGNHKSVRNSRAGRARHFFRFTKSCVIF